jgi:tetratricopeptide (TPR) repeat protein
MNYRQWLVLLLVLVPVFLQAQVEKIVIAAGTPEDHELQAISNEPDAQKKLTMYQDFVQKFASNPQAVAYGNWQLSQAYQNTGDFPKALDYGDKALAGAPRDLDILISQAGIAQQMKNNAKVLDYSVRGGQVCSSINKETKPEGMSDQDFASYVADEKTSSKTSCDFLEAAGFNAISNETDAKTRMSDIERYAAAFPNSQYEEQITQYAMVSLSELKDMPRLIAFGEKTLAANPKSLTALLLLSGAYADDPQPGSLAKAVTYAQRAIDVAKADAPDADRTRKLSGGMAHSTLGYAYMKQNKTAAAVPELQAAVALLKGQDDQQYAIALYRLGYAYAKLPNHSTEARAALNEAVKIPGPVQPLAQSLLAQVNAARAKGK